MAPGAGVWRALPAPIRRLAVALALVQLLFLALHYLTHPFIAIDQAPASGSAVFDFTREASVQTWWSAAVLSAAGVVAFWIRFGPATDRLASLAWTLVGAGFVWLGAEELLQLHEEVQLRLAVDWPLVYLPALLVGIGAILVAAADLPSDLRIVMFSGLACLGAAISAELAWDSSVFEENLELAGAALVLVSGLAGAVRRQRPAPAPASVPAPHLAGNPE